MKYSKLTKKAVVTALVAVVGITGTALAFPNFQSKQINYDVNLVVKGSPYNVQTLGLKPFLTSDGYTYLSIRSLSDLGLLNINWDGSTRTVTVDENKAQNDEMIRLANENAALKIENAKLKEEKAKAETKKAEDDKKKAEEKKKEESRNKLRDVDSRDRRDLERDLRDELDRRIRIRSDYGNPSYDVSVSLNRDNVKVVLTDNDTLDADTWNKIVDGRDGDYLADSYDSAFRDYIFDPINSQLKKYTNYDIDISVNATYNNGSQEIASGSYRESTGRYAPTYVNVYKKKTDK